MTDLANGAHTASMNLLILISSVLLAAGSAVAQSPHTPGVWEEDSRVSQLDGDKTVTETLISENSVAVLMLKCADKHRSAIVAVPGGFLGLKSVPVEWRIGEGEIQRDTWLPLEGVPEAIIAEAHPAHRFLNALLQPGDLVIRLRGYGEIYEIVFKIGDGRSHVEAINLACPNG